MKGIFQFIDWQKMAANMTLTSVSCGPWTDYQTKAKLGTKVEVFVSRDDNKYRPKSDGSVFTNLGERFTIRVPGDVQVPIGETVIPVEPVEVSVFGQYNEKFSVRASGIKVVSGKNP